MRVAGPAAFTNSISPAGLALLTALLASEGQAAVAGFGAGGRIQAFASVPLLALSGSIGAIVGQNWGARQPGTGPCRRSGRPAPFALHMGWPLP